MINEIQTYKKAYAIEAYKEGYEVYATQILRTSDRAEDCRLWSVDDILNVEKALFIIKEVEIK
tara:strand:+ start:293 stop:481 length:189 start_codon:yes stop_codon:yes gene_type:complete